MGNKVPLGDTRPLPRLRAAIRGTPIHHGYRRVRAWRGARREAADLSSVATYCLFLGHGRSGHSIVGALLDAHPQIVISDELSSLLYLEKGYSRDQLLWLSLHTARDQARRLRQKRGRGGKVYSYAVPGQWQGRAQDLRVVGTSDAGRTLRALADDPELLERLRHRLQGIDLRFIQVMRNPYDNIATMMLRSGRTFESAFSRYFEGWRLIEQLLPHIGHEPFWQMRHEDLVANPHRELDQLCSFLGVPAPEDYLEACAGIIFPSAAQSRESIDWTEEQRHRIDAAISETAGLSGYSFPS